MKPNGFEAPKPTTIQSRTNTRYWYAISKWKQRIFTTRNSQSHYPTIYFILVIPCTGNQYLMKVESRKQKVIWEIYEIQGIKKNKLQKRGVKDIYLWFMDKKIIC